MFFSETRCIAVIYYRVTLVYVLGLHQRSHFLPILLYRLLLSRILLDFYSASALLAVQSKNTAYSSSKL